MVTVLIVEDDEETRTIYRDSLESHGYRVVAASHGAEGVAIARRIKPDLILMDICMPVMDGQQAMRYLKSDPATARIPVFGISALAEAAGSGRLRFDRFLVEPLEVNEVVAAIQARIGPPRPKMNS